MKNNLHIISGRLKGRKVAIPNKVISLKPTKSIIRETLFNWLYNSRLLFKASFIDAFSGSGILGFEAISRGARFCKFVDINAKTVRYLIKNITSLNLHEFTEVSLENSSKLLSEISGYDVILLDPPFSKDLLEKSLCAILQNPRIGGNNLIYIEYKKYNDIISKFSIHKKRKFGNIYCALLRKYE